MKTASLLVFRFEMTGADTERLRGRDMNSRQIIRGRTPDRRRDGVSDSNRPRTPDRRRDKTPDRHRPMSPHRRRSSRSPVR